MFENIHFIKNYYSIEQDINKYILRNNKIENISFENNNDTINILASLFSTFNFFIYSTYNSFMYYISLLKQFKFRCHFFLLLIFMLFTFVITFESNSNISTNLIISAYFNKKSITRITYDKLLEKEREKEFPEINYEDYQNLKDSINYDENGGLEDFLSDGHITKNNEPNKNNKKCNIINDDSTLEGTISKMKKQNNNSPNSDYFVLEKNTNHFKINFDNEDFKSILIAIFSFLYCYFFIKYTIYSKIKDSFIFNVISIIINFNILYSLYQNEFYFTSNFFFTLVIYNKKCIIESVYIMLKYNRKDFEIFSTSLIALNYLQFFFKFIILINLTLFSGFLSIFFFRTWFNFILFYICLFTLIVFLSNCLQSTTISPFKPLKNLIIFFFGLSNLIFSKLLSHTIVNKFSFIFVIRYGISENNSNIDSLYFISDLFSLFCFSYLRGFLEFQIEALLLIGQIIIQKDNVVQDLLKKKEKIENNYIWVYFFTISFILCILELYTKEKICIFMSIYIAKILLSYFSNIYSPESCKIFCYIFSFFFLIFNLEYSSCKENTYLINLIFSFTQINKDILSFSLKIIMSLLIYYFIITVNFNIIFLTTYEYKNVSKLKNFNNDELEKITNMSLIKRKNNEEDLSLIFLKCIFYYFDAQFHYFLLCLLIAIYQYYEDSNIIKIIIAFLIPILCISETIYMKNIENSFNYYVANFIWLWLILRLILLCNSEFSVIFCLCHLNLQIFLYFFYANNKNQMIFNIIFLVVIIIKCYQIYSMIFYTYVVIVTCAISLTYIYNNIKYIYNSDSKKNKDEKESGEYFDIINVYTSLSLLFLIPIIIFFLIHFKFPKYNFLINYLDTFIKEAVSILDRYYANITAKENYDWIDSYEFNFIDYMINLIETIKMELKIY